MVTRAGVSRSSFYEVFQTAEECFLATFDEGLTRLCQTVEQAIGREVRWVDRVRAGLIAVLGFLDDEPGWGRLLLFTAPLADATAFRCEQRVLDVLRALLDDDGPEAISELTCEPQLTGELVIGGVISVLRARMSESSGRSLLELAPSLMSFIVKPYRGEAAARAELADLYAAAQETPPWESGSALPLVAGSSPVPVTHRTALVLEAIASAPRSSNREIAAAAGLGDEGQTSHLLRRLERRGLIEKVTPLSGSRRENAWILTHSGRGVIELLRAASSAARRPSIDANVREAA